MCLPVKPFKVELEWKHMGLSCAVVQNREGMNRCGYVRVPSTHPYFGMDYNEIDVNVHGGLTFGEVEPCTEHEDGQGFWFGFDCAHCDDMLCDPLVDRSTLSKDTQDIFKIYDRWPRAGSHYWTHADVVDETCKLAEQLALAS